MADSQTRSIEIASKPTHAVDDGQVHSVPLSHPTTVTSSAAEQAQRGSRASSDIMAPSHPAAEQVPSLHSNATPHNESKTTYSSTATHVSASPPRAYPQPVSISPLAAGPSSGSSPNRAIPPPQLLSTHLIAHPSDSAGRAIRKVFPSPNPISRLIRRFKVKHSVISGLTSAEEKRWNAEGGALRRRAGWKLKDENEDGVVVSELFWKVCSTYRVVQVFITLDVYFPFTNITARSPLRSRPAGPAGINNDHASLNHIPHSRYHAALSRCHYPSGERGLPGHELLAVRLQSFPALVLS